MAGKKARKYVVARNVAWRLVAGELFAITPDGRQHHVESPTGVFIWSEIDKGRSERAQLLKAVLAEFEIDPKTAAADLDEFLASLLSAALISLE